MKTMNGIRNTDANDGREPADTNERDGIRMDYMETVLCQLVGGRLQDWEKRLVLGMIEGDPALQKRYERIRELRATADEALAAYRAESETDDMEWDDEPAAVSSGNEAVAAGAPASASVLGQLQAAAQVLVCFLDRLLCPPHPVAGFGDSRVAYGHCASADGRDWSDLRPDHWSVVDGPDRFLARWRGTEAAELRLTVKVDIPQGGRKRVGVVCAELYGTVGDLQRLVVVLDAAGEEVRIPVDQGEPGRWAGQVTVPIPRARAIPRDPTARILRIEPELASRSS